MRNRYRKLLSGVLMVPFALWACGGGGGGTSPGGGESTGVVGSSVSEAPVAGQFLADCPADTAMIDGFAPDLSIPGDGSDLPSVGEVLTSGDADAIPVIGGVLQLDENLPAEVQSLDADEALAMIPAGGLSGSLPVLGTAPVTCGDFPALDPSDPSLAPGLVPVFDPNGEVIGVILATLGGDDDVIDVGVPGGVLPAEFEAVVGTLLEILGTVAPQPSPTPTSGGSEPTPTPTPQPSGGICNESEDITCPTGQICVQNPEYPAGWGNCQGLSL